MVESIQSSGRIVSSAALERPIRVLYIDDDQSFLKVAKQCLETQGEIDIDTVSSVNEASEKLKKTDYDVIVSDYQMPGKDGLEFLKELREKGNTVPFIVFTGKGREEIAIKALNLGADGYFNKSGHPETVYGELAHGMRLVVGRRRAEQSFLKSEDKYRRLVETLHEGIWVIDKDSRTTFVNPRMAEILGYGIEEMKGRPLFSFMDERGVEIAKRLLERRKQNIIEQHDFEFLRKDGTRVYTTLETAPITDDNGNYIGALASVMDITERKKAEKEIENLARFPSENPSPIFRIAKDGVILYANAAAKSMLGELKIEIGQSAPHHWRRLVSDALDSGLRKDVEVENEDRMFLFTLTPVANAAYVNVYGIDITERKQWEETLWDAKEKWASLTENTDDIVMITDNKGVIQFINRTIPPYTPEETVGKTVYDYVPREQHDVFEKSLREVFKTGKPDRYEVSSSIPKIGTIWFSTKIVPIKHDRKVSAAILISANITDRKKAEEALRNTRNYLDSLLNYANAPIIVWDNVKRITLFNNAFEALTGHKKESMLGRNIDILFPPLQKEEILQTIQGATKGEKWKSVEIPLLCKDKETKIALWNSANITDEEGKIIATIAQGQDITERRKAEQALKESEEKYRSLVELAPDGIVAVSTEGIVTSVSRSFLTLLGYDSEEGIVGKPFTELMTMRIEDIPRFQGMFMSLMKGESPSPSEFLYVRRDGTSRWAEVHPSLMIKDGNPVGVQAIMRDVSERKKAEEQLRDSEERLSVLFELAPDAYYLNDLKGNFIDGNKAAEELTGYTRNELIGKSFLKLKLLPRSQALKATKLLAMNALGKPTGPDEFVLNRKDGTRVPAEIRTHPVKIKDKTLVLGIARDISIRKKNEQAILESQQKFEGLFRHNPEAAVYLDLDSKVLDVNPRFCELFGYSAKEVEGKQINEIVVPEDMIEEAETLDKDAKKGYASHDTVRKRKDGSLVNVSISAAPVTIEGRLLGYVGVYKDITELKNAEERLKKTNEKLEITNEKLHVVGGLTRHDVRNKLSAVTGNAYLLKRKLTEDPKALEQLNDMEAAVRLVERIFEFARTYEKLGVEQPSYMDIGKTFDEAVSLFSDLKRVKIVNECGGLTVLADSLLNQLFYNLVDNSLKYGEKIQQIKIYCKTPSPDQLELVYEDDGAGIPDNMRSNLFKEGFTSGKGTGYGLFMIKRICETYGWTIQETGKQGKGAQFTMSIPRMHAKARA